MAEIENKFIELDKYWRQLAEEDCYRFESIRIRGGRLGKLHNTIQQRVARWASKLHQLGDNLLRQFINALQNPQVRKLVISLLRRLLTFVPVLGHVIKIILFIYDWHTGGFWNAVKGFVFQNNSHDMYYSKRGTILACGGIPYEPSIQLHRT